MDIKSGQTDAKITGTLDNLMGYLFSDQQLKGRFNVQSNTFSVNDFMVAQTEETTNETENTSEEKETTPTPTGEEAIKIPSFLDARLDFNAKNVIYDNLTLKNTKGAVVIVDETASLENVSADIFGGNIGISGNVSTKNATPVFDMQLNLNRIDIVESFQNLELIQNLAPLAKALQGSLNTKINLSGNLTNELTPILTSLGGTAFAQIINAQVDTEKTPLLSKLDGQLNFINLDNLALKDLATNLKFNNGQIEVDPFNFNIKDINITAGGSHSFDNQMNYNLELDIPAKYLGSEVGNGLASLTKTDLENTKVQLPIGLSGSFNSPQIQLNMKQAVTDLTQQIVAKQKDELKDKAKEEVGNKLKDLLGGNKENTQTTQDSTSTEEKSDEDKVKEAAGKVLNGLFGKKKDDKK